MLVAIREDYVDGVDCLLVWEEEHHKEGTLYSWEQTDQVTANFSPDMTPLILAGKSHTERIQGGGREYFTTVVVRNNSSLSAHGNNYEIIKMLLDRGAMITIPHDIKCGCEECIEAQKDDSLRFSLARINSYKALASSSMIALSSRDPIITGKQIFQASYRNHNIISKTLACSHTYRDA